MKKLLAALAVSAAAMLPPVTSAAPILSIVPATQTAAVGDSVQVEVVISGLDSVNEIVGAYDLNIIYNTLLLQWSVISQFTGDFGGGGSVVSGIDGTNGSIGGDLTSLLSDAELDALQGDSISLFRFQFTTLTDGAAFLNFGSDPDLERMVVGRDFTPLALTYVGACIAIGTGSCEQVVPEPASLALLGLALAGLGFARRRRSV